MEDQLAENPSTNTNEKAEPGHLLEDSWFFGNLLDKGKTKTMMRCMSDPSSSSSSSSSPRTPPPPSLEDRKHRTRNQGTPPWEEDPDNEFALSRLIRQASLTSSDVFLPPKQPLNKVTEVLLILSTPFDISTKTHLPKPQGNKKSSIYSVPRPIPSKPIEPRLRKSVSNLETEVGMFDGTEQRSGIGSGEDQRWRRRLFRQGEISDSESRHQVPSWIDKASSAEDVKAQIKCWARSVAANVR